MAGVSAKTRNEIRKIIFRFLDPEEYQTFIFGSRAENKAGKFSDYDIGILGNKPIPPEIKISIEESLEESDLPYKVEIVDFCLVPSNFKKVALLKIVKL